MPHPVVFAHHGTADSFVAPAKAGVQFVDFPIFWPASGSAAVHCARYKLVTGGDVSVWRHAMTRMLARKATCWPAVIIRWPARQSKASYCDRTPALFSAVASPRKSGPSTIRPSLSSATY